MKIVWTRFALLNLDQAYDYIAVSNPGAAVSTIERIEKAIESLSVYPEIGRQGRIAGTRELVITGTPFIVPYRVQGDQIEILALIHSARRWSDNFS